MMTRNRSVRQATAMIPQYDVIDRDLHSDVLVAGGCIIGLTTALYLRQEGTDVILLETRRIGATPGSDAPWPSPSLVRGHRCTCSSPPTIPPTSPANA
jgi:hypothetical protein